MNLPIAIEKDSGVPLYVQLGERLRLLVRMGTLQPGEPLPTVRSLAVHLGINANTVARVYRELQADGLLRLEQGVGTFVAAVDAERSRKSELKILDRKVTELIRLGKHIGMGPSELSQFIEARWPEVD